MHFTWGEKHSGLASVLLNKLNTCIENNILSIALLYEELILGYKYTYSCN